MSRRVKRKYRKKDKPWRGQAKRRILFELFYFLIAALVLSGGYTISYFTSQAEVPPNVFTAGTVLVTAGDAEGNLVISDHGDNTWSPGECRELELTIKNTGSKRAYARARFEADWKAQYHTNIATVTANYLPSGQTEPVQIQRSTNCLLYTSAGRGPLQRGYRCLLPGNGGEAFPRAAGSVSYTHLDVYKRQG